MNLEASQIIIWSIFLIVFFYVSFWLVVLFEGKATTKKQKYKVWPTVTVAIPVLNEEKTVAKTIHSIFKLDYPVDKLRVICINDGSTDTTQRILTALQKTYPKLEVLKQKNAGKFAALNNALKSTNSEFFSCLDADSFVTPKSLKLLLADFTDKKIAAVMPIMKVHEPKNWLMKWQQIEYLNSIYLKLLMQERDCIPVTPGPFTTFRTAIIKELGGYRKGHYTEDIELALRLQKHHYTLRQSYDAMIETRTPVNLKQYYKQRIRWYGGTVKNAYDYRALMFKKEYHDFGFLQLPMLLVAGFFSMISVFIVYGMIMKQQFYQVKYMYLTGFDFMTYINSFTLSFDALNTDFFVVTLTISLLLLAVFIIKYSFNMTNEPIRKRDFPTMICFMIFYSVVNSGIWLAVAYRLIRRKAGWTR